MKKHLITMTLLLVVGSQSMAQTTKPAGTTPKDQPASTHQKKPPKDAINKADSISNRSGMDRKSQLDTTKRDNRMQKNPSGMRRNEVRPTPMGATKTDPNGTGANRTDPRVEIDGTATGTNGPAEKNDANKNANGKNKLPSTPPVVTPPGTTTTNAGGSSGTPLPHNN